MSFVTNAQLMQPIDDISNVSKEYIEYKIKKYDNQREAGLLITCTGVGVTFAGIASTITSLDNGVPNDYKTGLIISTIGAAIISTGVPFWINGATKKARYEAAWDRKQLSLAPTMLNNKSPGFYLCYKF